NEEGGRSGSRRTKSKANCPLGLCRDMISPVLDEVSPMSVSRRDFLGAGAAAAAGLALPKLGSAMPIITVHDRSAPPRAPFAGRPVVISAANGHDTDANGKQGIKVAYDMVARGGDPLDAIVAGVQIVELNPRDQSVGLGGLPNEEGVVQLDASCMHGPTKRA